MLVGPCCRVLDHSDLTMVQEAGFISSPQIEDSLEKDGMSDERISGFHMCSPLPSRFGENRTNLPCCLSTFIVIITLNLRIVQFWVSTTRMELLNLQTAK